MFKKNETKNSEDVLDTLKPWQPVTGRRTKLTPKLIEEIGKWISEGQTEELSCQLCGITSASLRSWKKKAREIEEALGDDEPQTDQQRLFLSFLVSLTHARAWAVANSVRAITKASKTDWRAAAWFLERTDPDNFGSVQRHRHEFAKYSDEDFVRESERLFGKDYAKALEAVFASQ